MYFYSQWLVVCRYKTSKHFYLYNFECLQNYGLLNCSSDENSNTKIVIARLSMSQCGLSSFTSWLLSGIWVN